MRYIKSLVVAALFLGLVQETAQAYPGVVVGNIGVAVQPSAPGVVVNVAARPDQWRYRWSDGRWWYWTPENRWMWYDGGQWVHYVPGYPAAGDGNSVPYSTYYAPSYNNYPGYGYSYPSSGYYDGYPGYYGGSYGPGVSIGVGGFWNGNWGGSWHGDHGHGHDGHGEHGHEGHDGHGHH